MVSNSGSSSSQRRKKCFFFVETKCAPELFCFVCSAPWLDPVRFAPCGHVVCAPCAGRGDMCLTCGANAAKQPTPRPLLKETVAQLRGFCTLCHWAGTYGEYTAAHQASCMLDEEHETGTGPTLAHAPPFVSLSGAKQVHVAAAANASMPSLTGLGQQDPAPFLEAAVSPTSTAASNVYDDEDFGGEDFVESLSPRR